MTFHRGVRLAEPALEPALLPAAEHAAPRRTDAGAGLDVHRVRAAAAPGPRAGLPGAVLAAVEQVEACERPPVEMRVDLHARSLRLHARRQRHVLVVGAVRGRAAREEGLALHAVLGPIVGVVVVHLVVVPDDDPWTGRVRVLQVRIAPIERVARTVVLERVGLRRAVAAHVVAAPARFVDVVAKERDEIGRIGDDVAIRAEIPLLILLAGSEGEPQPARRPWSGRALCACGRCGFARHLQ